MQKRGNRWLEEVDRASKRERAWRECADKAERDYTDDDNRLKFNILFSNTQTILPALYNSTPRPDVRRRYRDRDPVGKVVSEILERALSYSVDAYDFDESIRATLLDYVLPGRGVVRVRYKPTYGEPVAERLPVEREDEETYSLNGEAVEGVQEDDDGPYVEGDEYSPVVHEEVVCEHVFWDDFRILGTARCWDDVPGIAFRHRMTRADLLKEFGEAAATVPMNWSPKEDHVDESKAKLAEVWEVWDKTERKVAFVSEGMDGPIEVRDDPLRLEGFFPVPRPLYSIHRPRSLEPKPEYDVYRSQAAELNKISARIVTLTGAIRARFIYDPSLGDSIGRMFDADEDGVMVPADPAAIDKLMAMKGGFSDAVWAAPIDMLVAVLMQLLQQREQVKAVIYEITGVSDILRGSTDPDETLGAQRIKAQYGSLRLTQRQRDVQRFIRDIFRLKAEIYAEHFSAESLQMMTGVQLPTMQDKMAAQMAAQAGQDAEQAQKVLGLPTWEEVMDLMRSDLMRGYRIDVETDSTIQADEGYDQRSFAELYKGVADFVSVMGPMAQQGVIPMATVKEMLLGVIRRFHMGRQIEDSIEDISDSGQGNGQQAAQQQMQLEMQAKQADMQAKLQQTQMKMEADKAKHGMEMQKLAAEQQQMQVELQIEQERLAIERQRVALEAQKVSLQAVGDAA